MIIRIEVKCEHCPMIAEVSCTNEREGDKRLRERGWQLTGSLFGIHVCPGCVEDKKKFTVEGFR